MQDLPSQDATRSAGSALLPQSVDSDEAQMRAFRRLADVLPELVWTSDPVGQHNYFSPRWAGITDLKPWEGNHPEMWADIVHPDDIVGVDRAWTQALQDLKPFVVELRMRRHAHAAEWRWYATQAEPEYNAAGKIIGWIGTTTDITNHKRAEEKATQAAERLQLLLSQAPLVLLVTDINGVYTQGVGRGMAAMGLTSEQIVGLSLLERTESMPELHAKVKRVLAGEDLSWESYNHGRWWEIHGTPLRDEQGALAGLASICFDITERKTADQLATSEQIARDAAELKSQFLATMSHEIRTPLGGILGIAQMLADTPLVAEARALVDMLRQSGQGLLTVVDEILDYSKLEAGRVVLHTAPLSLRAFLRSQLARVADAARAQGLTLRLDVDPKLEDRWLGDASQIGVVLQHFLSNGIKFTKKGQVALKCGYKPFDNPFDDPANVPGVSPEPPKLRFSVVDSGVGIDPAMESMLFQPFVQADVSHTRTYGGTGLGLSICRGLAQLMQGQVGYRSILGEGTTLFLDLPLPVADPNEATSDKPVAATVTTGRVLVADDSIVSQTILKAALEKLGHRVTLVDSGQAALHALTQDAYDLVLMDCQMPVLDGYETAARIRARPPSLDRRHLPIIALTASSLPEDEARCRAAGMDNFLMKPFSDVQLRTALAPWFGL